MSDWQETLFIPKIKSQNGEFQMILTILSQELSFHICTLLTCLTQYCEVLWYTIYIFTIKYKNAL